MNLKAKKIVLLMAAVMLLTFSLSDCGAKADNVLTVGVDDTYPPMEYRDESGNMTGFDVEMAKALGESMGMEVKFQSVAWEGIFGGLDVDKYDCIISSVSMTPERLENYEFTTPYLANGQVIVVKPGDESIKEAKDLASKKVGVQAGTTADTSVTKYEQEHGIDLTRYDEIIQTFAAMETGRIDCIVVDYAVAIDYSMKHPDKYQISSVQLTNEPIAICIKKGNVEMKNKLQKALDDVRSKGILSDLSIKYLGEDYTENIDTNLY